MYFKNALVFAIATSLCVGTSAGNKDKHRSVGYIQDGGVEYFCQHGDLIDGVCISHEMSPQIQVCNDGVLDNGICLVRSASRSVCPVGFTEIFDQKKKGKRTTTRQCMQMKTANYELSCAEGFMNELGMCVKSVSVAASSYCPLAIDNKGKGEQRGLNDCFQYEQVQPEFACDEGLQLVGEFCVGTVRGECFDDFDTSKKADGGKKNRDGYNLYRQGGKKNDVAFMPGKVKFCDRQVNLGAYRSCPLGSIESGSGATKKKEGTFSCIRRVDVAMLSRCMDGYVFDEELQLCGRQIETNALRTCPMGFQVCDAMQGKGKNKKQEQGIDGCCRVDMAELEMICQDGFEMRGNGCFKVLNAELACPQGFSFDGNGCIKQLRSAAHFRYNFSLIGKNEEEKMKMHKVKSNDYGKMKSNDKGKKHDNYNH